jgi:hypothetical protein
MSASGVFDVQPAQRFAGKSQPLKRPKVVQWTRLSRKSRLTPNGRKEHVFHMISIENGITMKDQFNTIIHLLYLLICLLVLISSFDGTTA